MVVVGVVAPQSLLAIPFALWLDELPVVQRALLRLLMSLLLPASPALISGPRDVRRKVAAQQQLRPQGHEELGPLVLVKHQVAVRLRLTLVVAVLYAEIW